jgi:hypothetical protein
LGIVLGGFIGLGPSEHWPWIPCVHSLSILTIVRQGNLEDAKAAGRVQMVNNLQPESLTQTGLNQWKQHSDQLDLIKL